MTEADENSYRWDDRAYVVHPEMKSYTGIFLTNGKGVT